MAHRTTSLLLLNSKPCRCYKEHVQLVFFFFCNAFTYFTAMLMNLILNTLKPLKRCDNSHAVPSCHLKVQVTNYE